jgi:hypothetical protein
MKKQIGVSRPFHLWSDDLPRKQWFRFAHSEEFICQSCSCGGLPVPWSWYMPSITVAGLLLPPSGWTRTLLQVEGSSGQSWRRMPQVTRFPDKVLMGWTGTDATRLNHFPFESLRTGQAIQQFGFTDDNRRKQVPRLVYLSALNWTGNSAQIACIFIRKSWGSWASFDIGSLVFGFACAELYTYPPVYLFTFLIRLIYFSTSSQFSHKYCSKF